MSNRNIIAIGRSRYLYDSIEYLINNGYVVKAIITEEAYNEYDIKSDDFRALTEKIGCPLFIGKEIYSDPVKEIIRVYDIRCAISVNWKLTITPDFFNLFEYGIINFHLGSLPDYKGNATANWAIINGENEIYASMHKMDIELDSGDIVARHSIAIGEDSYINDIIGEAEKVVPSLYKEALDNLYADKNYYLIKGSVNGSRCYPRLEEDSRINWNESSDDISRLIRASAKPFGGAFCSFKDEKLIVWKAKPYQSLNPFYAMPGHIVKLNPQSRTVIVACKGNMLELEEIELAGKIMNPMDLFKSIRLRLR